MNEGSYMYRVYGLSILSEMPFPELEVDGSGLVPDVRILFKPVPESLGNPKYSGFKCEVDKGIVLIRTDTIAKLLISGGDKIFIEKRKGARDYEIRMLLLGWGFGAVLHQRGVLPLHASAVALDQRGLALCAHSGYGKSTLAYAFLKRGYRILDDNIAALIPDEDGILVLPGYPEIKLQGSDLRDLKEKPRSVRPLLQSGDRYAVGLSNHFQREPVRLSRIFVLSRSASPSLKMTTLEGAAAFKALAEHTFCPKFLKCMEQPSKHFDKLVDLASRMPVFQLQFSIENHSPDEIVQLIKDNLHELIS